MTKEQKEQIANLRGKGIGYATIAGIVGLSKGAVAAYCQRNDLASRQGKGGLGIRCANCGSGAEKEAGGYCFHAPE